MRSVDGIRTEAIAFADAKARVTRRLRQQIGVDCQSMPTSKCGGPPSLGESQARRARVPARVGPHRPRRRPRHLADVPHGAVGPRIGWPKNGDQRGGVVDDVPRCPATRRGRGGLYGHASALRQRRGAPVAQRRSCSIRSTSQHASAALDDVRRQEFFRAGAVMRAFGRGRRLRRCAAADSGTATGGGRDGVTRDRAGRPTFAPQELYNQRFVHRFA